MLSADRLRAQMALHGLSQAELARRVGISQQTIAHLVSGQAFGSKHIHQIARALGTTPAYLMRETDDPSSDAVLEEFTLEERTWIDLLRAAEPEDRKAIIRLTRTIATNAASATLHDKRLAFKGAETASIPAPPAGGKRKR
ncbi:MAG: helix-turn-helix transcriptional regulator [Novosphingobium sp.]